MCKEIQTIGFSGTKQIAIDKLGLSQIYLSAEKLAAVEEWFHPQRMDNFVPLRVHDFGAGCYTITDGHTRAYAAYKNGVSALPAVYDNDDMVTNPIGQMQYQADLEWCKRFGLSHIGHLKNRILDKAAYQRLWRERCDRSYDLLTGFSVDERLRLQQLAPDLFLYGASEDMSILFFEDKAGELYFYRDHTLQLEDPYIEQ